MRFRQSPDRPVLRTVRPTRRARGNASRGTSRRRGDAHDPHSRIASPAAPRTCAALRATELQADVLLKATKVDGIYSADPKKDPTAKRYETITYEQVLKEKLRVMDLTAITLCMERRIPLVVFDMKVPGNIARVVRGESIGTTIKPV